MCERSVWRAGWGHETCSAELESDFRLFQGTQFPALQGSCAEYLTRLKLSDKVLPAGFYWALLKDQSVLVAKRWRQGGRVVPRFIDEDQVGKGVADRGTAIFL